MSHKLSHRSQAFLDYLEDWQAGLPVLPLDQAMPEPHKVAIVSVDVIEGFCRIGPLSSSRVAGIIEPIVRLFNAAWSAGMHHILLIQDNHEPDAIEFGAYPPHCVRGTPEAETVAELKALPFFDQMVVLPKNSVSTDLNTGLDAWMDAHPQIDTWIAVGDCTDICTYQLAMHLRMAANSRQLHHRVIVPADCVETYDRPIAIAREQGGFAHDGDLLHTVFLYHMALNGVEVAKKIES